MTIKYIQVKCEYCGGEGRFMEMVCYGGSPFEKYERCSECYGEGTIEYEEGDYIIAKLAGEVA